MSRSPDPLEEALAAFREKIDGRTDEQTVHDSRDAVLAGVRASKERRPPVLAMAAAVLLAFTVGLPTAWAWTTGALDPLLEQLGVIAPAPEQRPEAARRTAPTVPPAIDAPEPLAEAPLAVEPPPVETPAAETSVAETRVAETRVAETRVAETRVAPRPTTRAPTTRAPRGPESAEPFDTAERELFEAAHRTHFGGGSPDAALSAWDAYLAAHPRGRYAPEAGYNRALCLVRLGRYDDAREALTPFAAGAYRGVRADDAQQLLDALENR